MTDGNPPRKKRWGMLKRNHSDHHLSNERGRTETDDSERSSLPPSQAQPGRGPSRLVRKLWAKVTKSPSPQSVGRSLNPAPTTSSSNTQDPTSNQSSQGPSPNTVPVSEASLDQDTNSRDAKAETPDQWLVEGKIAGAKQSFAGVSQVPEIVQKIGSAPNKSQSASDAINAIETFSAILRPLEIFNSIANTIADIHPYAKAVMSVFTCASNMILSQAERDDAVSALLERLSEVYTLMNDDTRLAEIPSMQALYGKIARQTLECADFIVHYSETKSAWKRLGRDIFTETAAIIQNYNSAFDTLMLRFRDQAVRDTVLNIHDMDRAVHGIDVKIYRMAEDLDFKDMIYVNGAGRDTSKRCLPGTREGILSEIKDWVDKTGEDVEQVFWLSGTAGKGKSAIAHTIANWFDERGGPGACFCFDRTREADRRHEKIFTTMARDLADHDPIMRRTLARAVLDDNELRHTNDITRQWEKFILEPVGASQAIDAPVLMVIDALDETGDVRSREQILRMLAGNLNPFPSEPTKLPTNLRILVTSRPLDDIRDVLDSASHVRHVSVDDTSHVSAESAVHDIQLYISTKLGGPRSAFNDGDFKELAQKSDGLFEWARLACEHIRGQNRVGVDPVKRFKDLVAGSSEKGTRLLDKMYRKILAEIMPEDDEEIMPEDDELIAAFRSVMGQVIASLEPLSVSALKAMRLHFPSGDSSYRVEQVIGPMGSLVTGTADFQTPVRPLHASFYDFLTDKSRSHKFYVDTSLVKGGLAFASLGVMEGGLCFNICKLPSSYLPNSAVLDLEERVKKFIPAELSYSCRFWTTHVRATCFDSSLAKEVQAFFDGERLLFWLEALSLMEKLSSSVGALSYITDWLMGHDGCKDIWDAVKDTQRFVRTFAPAIVHSTPHLYLSALPFAPTQSMIFKKFAAKFSCTPRVLTCHAMTWPVMEKIIHTNALVYTVAIAPDGSRIVSGSDDNAIQVWDAETGKPLGAPLLGHTRYVSFVAISPDGSRIVSGSDDRKIRVWDAETGKPLGAPLLGHTRSVQSVAISPDGSRIVSGSADNTIRVWDAETGKPLGAPLLGHTDDVQSVAISPDGNRIVSGSDDKTIRVWDAETGKPLGAPLLGHTDRVQSVAISPDGSRIVSGSHDKTIRVWDAETGKPLGAPLLGHTDDVQSVAISRDGSRIVSGSLDETIRVWDAETGKPLGAPLLGHTHYVRPVAISPDGSRIVSGSDDMTILVWDAETGKPLGDHLRRHMGSVWSVAISLDGSRIVSGSQDETIRVWDAETGKPLGAPLLGHTDYVRSVAISPDGSRIVSGSQDDTIRVWDAETGKPLGAPLLGHTGYVCSVAISPDGSRIVSGSGDNTIRVWDAETGEALGVPLQCVDWHGNTSSIFFVAFLRDGSHIVSGSADHTIRVWDLSAFLDPLQTLETPAICFSSNPTHALRDAPSFLSDSHTPLAASLVITQERWMVGPTGCLLLWVPPYFPHVYARGNTITMPDVLQLDLSCFAHGTSWYKCRG